MNLEKVGFSEGGKKNGSTNWDVWTEAVFPSQVCATVVRSFIIWRLRICSVTAEELASAGWWPPTRGLCPPPLTLTTFTFFTKQSTVRLIRFSIQSVSPWLTPPPPSLTQNTNIFLWMAVAVPGLIHCRGFSTHTFYVLLQTLACPWSRWCRWSWTVCAQPWLLNWGGSESFLWVSD